MKVVLLVDASQSWVDSLHYWSHTQDFGLKFITLLPFLPLLGPWQLTFEAEVVHALSLDVARQFHNNTAAQTSRISLIRQLETLFKPSDHSNRVVIEYLQRKTPQVPPISDRNLPSFQASIRLVLLS